MLPRRLVDRPLVLVMALLRFDALDSEGSRRKNDEQAPVLGQGGGGRSPIVGQDVVSRVVPMLAPGPDFAGVPEIAQGEPLLAEGFEDVENNKETALLDVGDDPVGLGAPVVVDHPDAAVFDVGQAQEIDLLGADPAVSPGIVQEIEHTLARDGVVDTVAEFSLLLAHKDLLRADAEAVVEIILAELSVGSAGHIVAISGIVKEDGPAGHEQGDGILVGVAVGHLLLLDRDRVAEVIAVVEAAVAFVAVVPQQVGGGRLPAVAENDLFPLDIVHHFSGQPLGRSRRYGVRAPIDDVHEHIAEADARRRLEIDVFPGQEGGRPFQGRVFIAGRGGLEEDQVMGPVGLPVGVAEIGDHAGRAHQVEEVLGIVIKGRRAEQLVHAALGFGVSEKRVEPDAVIDGGVFDLPLAPVVVAQSFPLHLPDLRLRVAGQGPNRPGQVFGPQGGAVHGPPFLRPEHVVDAFGDERFAPGILGGRQPVQPMEDLVSPDVAHDREEIGQGGHGVLIVESQLAGPVREFGPIVPIGQDHFPGPGGVFGVFLPLIERGIDRGHFQEPAGSAVSEDVFGIEGFAPGGQGFVIVLPGPIGRSPGIGQIFGQSDRGGGRCRYRRNGGSGSRAHEAEDPRENGEDRNDRGFFFHAKGLPGIMMRAESLSYGNNSRDAKIGVFTIIGRADERTARLHPPDRPRIGLCQRDLSLPGRGGSRSVLLYSQRRSPGLQDGRSGP